MTRLATFGAMVSLLEKYFSKEPPDEKRLAVVRQFAEGLDAGTPDVAG